MSDVTAPSRHADTADLTPDRQRNSFEAVPVAMYRTTPDGAILNANPALVELLGYPNLEALQALDVRDIWVDASLREQHEDLLQSQGVIIGFEEELVHFTGRTIWVHDSVQLVRDIDGSALFYEGALIDITARKRAIEALEHSEERYRTLFHRSPVPLSEEDFSALAVWLDDLRSSGVTDLRGYLAEHPKQLRWGIDLIRIVDVNQATIDLVGAATKEQLLGAIPTEVLTPTYSRHIWSRSWPCGKAGAGSALNTSARRSPGTELTASSTGSWPPAGRAPTCRVRWSRSQTSPSSDATRSVS